MTWMVLTFILFADGDMGIVFSTQTASPSKAACMKFLPAVKAADDRTTAELAKDANNGISQATTRCVMVQPRATGGDK